MGRAVWWIVGACLMDVLIVFPVAAIANTWNRVPFMLAVTLAAEVLFAATVVVIVRAESGEWPWSQ